MGVLEYVNWPGTGLTLIGRRARRVLRKGEAGTATITGIEVERRTSSEAAAEPIYRYALDVRSGGRAFPAGVRQVLFPRGDEAHVGAVVPVKTRGDKVVVDWERHLGCRDPDNEAFVSPWRMVDPPPPGVHDRSRRKERERIAGGRSASLTVLSAAHGQSLFGPLRELDVQVELRYADGGVEQRGLRLRAPDYIRHQMRVGVVLPAGVDKGGSRVTIGWEAAANGGAGLDPSPSAVDATVAPLPEPAVNRFFGALQSFGEQAAGMGDASQTGDITLKQYAEITGGIVRERVPRDGQDGYAQRFGVPAGQWAQVEAAWRTRTMTNSGLGTRYHALYKAACKRR